MELVTLPGEEPGTAVRLLVESDSGYVRVQHLAHDPGLGWYVQKSMVLPREVLTQLIPQLRKAQCLMTSHSAKVPANTDSPALRLVHPPESDRDIRELRRRGA